MCAGDTLYIRRAPSPLMMFYSIYRLLHQRKFVFARARERQSCLIRSSGVRAVAPVVESVLYSKTAAHSGPCGRIRQRADLRSVVLMAIALFPPKTAVSKELYTDIALLLIYILSRPCVYSVCVCGVGISSSFCYCNSLQARCIIVSQTL